MTVEVRVKSVDQQVAVVALKGRLTTANSETLRKVVNKVVAGGANRIVLDLGQLDFIDSSGLGAIIGSLKTARQAGGDLRVVAPGDQVAMVFRLTNLDDVLLVYPNATTAFADDYL